MMYIQHVFYYAYCILVVFDLKTNVPLDVMNVKYYFCLFYLIKLKLKHLTIVLVPNSLYNI